MENIRQLLVLYPVVKILYSVVTIIAILLIRSILNRRIADRANQHNFNPTRSLHIRNFIRIISLLVLLLVLAIIWDWSIKGLSVYIASILTILGVAFFANWSILSNITASIVLFFFFPIRIGSRIKIVDGDNSAEGTIINISLFSLTIQNKDGKNIFYPNNLAIQKSILELTEREEEEII